MTFTTASNLGADQVESGFEFVVWLAMELFGEIVGSGKPWWVKLLASLGCLIVMIAAFAASRGENFNFSIGKVDPDRMDLIGRAMVGNDAARVTQVDIKTGIKRDIFVSRDGTVTYRPFQVKDIKGKYEANIEVRRNADSKVRSNAHFRTDE